MTRKPPKRSAPSRPTDRSPDDEWPVGTELVHRFRDKSVCRATVVKDGVHYRGTTYSPSGAGKAARRDHGLPPTTCDGNEFWKRDGKRTTSLPNDASPETAAAGGTEATSAINPPENARASPTTAISDSWLPPAIECLPALGRNGDKHEEFQKRVAIAFRLLGLTVDEVGYGQGYNDADFVAWYPDKHWGVICDAKATGKPYSLPADDTRAWTTYATKNIPKLRERGCNRVFFACVSSAFSESASEKAKQWLADPHGISAIALVRAETLIGFVGKNLQFGLTPSELFQLFSRPGIV